MSKPIVPPRPNTMDPTRLGTIEDVSGSTIRVRLEDNTASGLVFVRGEGYRVGQVGSFIRIPSGYIDLFGIVSQVGAGAAPGPPETAPLFGVRWLRAELVGAGGSGRRFERGVSRYPTIGDVAHVVTDSDLASIYAPGDTRGYVSVGRVASAESIPAFVDVNKLVSRHSAVVGSTGAGKSTTIASLLHALSSTTKFPAARIVLFDLHGEYATAFGQLARVYRVNSNPSPGESPLHIPFWALTADELLPLATGPLSGPTHAMVIDMITAMKRLSRPGGAVPAQATDDITADTPLPFCIHKLWYDLHCHHYATHTVGPNANQSSETRAYETGADTDQPVTPHGDAMSILRPRFRSITPTDTGSGRIFKSACADHPRSHVDTLESRLRDPRMAFLFKPGPWTTSPDGATDTDLDSLLAGWIGIDKPVTVIDLSGVPPAVIDDLIGAILRILYDAMFWGRNLPAGARTRPLLIALEEAHAYLSPQAKSKGAAAAARRIAKEGRKYGVGLMLISQRPSEIDPTILSQCGTLIAMRLTNETDRSQVRACASDSLEGLFSMLPSLRTGEALIVGEAVGLPVRALIDPPPTDRRPDSDDPKIVVPLGDDGKPVKKGGWTESDASDDYGEIVDRWRAQDAGSVLRSDADE